MLLLWLVACGTPAPASIPVKVAPAPPAADAPAPPAPSDGRLVLRLNDGTVNVGDEVVGDLPGQDPAGLVTALAEAVRATAAAEVTIEAPADARWLAVRQVAVSAQDGGVTKIWWRLGGRTVGPTDLEARSSGRLAGFCRGVRQPVSGVDTRFTVHLEANTEVSWARATARFRTVDEAGEPVEGLDPACWEDAACTDLVPSNAAACQAARDAGERVSDRVAIGAGNGCLVPLWKGARPTRWTVGEALTGLGAADHDVQLMPEARVTWDVVHATLVNLDETIGLPHLPLSVVQGNDGPPVCDATVRSADGIDEAAAIWLGAGLATASQ